MNIDGRDWPLVWCDMCQKAQPVVTDVCLAEDGSGDDYVDLMCAVCDNVIVVLSERSKPR